jgi:hypothetical protein
MGVSADRGGYFWYVSAAQSILSIFRFALLLFSLGHINDSTASPSHPVNRSLAPPPQLCQRKPKMPYIIVSFETRKPDLTPADFEAYYDNTHVPIIKEAVGPAFPKSHARYYLQRQPASTLPLVFLGSVDSVDYDAIVVMTFDSEQHFLDFQSTYAQPDVAARIGASAEKFIVALKLTVVALGEPHVTFA